MDDLFSKGQAEMTFARPSCTCDDDRKVTYLEQQIAVEKSFLSVIDAVLVVTSDRLVRRRKYAVHPLGQTAGLK